MALQHSTAKSPLKKGKGQLFAIQHFLYVIDGRAFSIEVQESSKGILTAHASSTLDPHESIESKTATTVDELLQAMTLEIDTKVSKW